MLLVVIVVVSDGRAFCLLSVVISILLCFVSGCGIGVLLSEVVVHFVVSRHCTCHFWWMFLF